ncbi:MAG: aldehyde dehydrogenase family protein [Georgfuchsia sp.]
MRSALLIVDLQQDYLNRPGLAPPPAQLLPAIVKLMSGFRDLGLPVFHAQTLVDANGDNRMPHWQRDGRWLCLRGSPGAQAPSSAAPRPGESVIAKLFFSAFGNPELAASLTREGIDSLVIAGLYTHACIRATALDAYQAGLSVCIASDAVASCETEHARISLEYLAARAIRCESVAELLTDLHMPGRIGCRGDGQPWQQHDPCNWEKVLSEVPLSGPATVDAAVAHAQAGYRHWAALSLTARTLRLHEWLKTLELRRSEFVTLLVRDVAKPLAEAEAEMDYGLSLLRQGLTQAFDEERTNSGTRVRYRPHGVVAAITPWNNPLSLALGKIGPALVYGNSLVWKPALAGTSIARLVEETLRTNDLEDVVQIVSGDAASGEILALHPDVAALSFTGSCAAGQRLARLCSITHKPLQAELGGNNPAIVLADIAAETIAEELAADMFSFSGQRCTAPRRIIVEAAQLERMTRALQDSVQRLVVGLPSERNTTIGPLISRDKRDRLLTAIETTIRDGGRLLCGGEVPAGFERGCWMAPTLMTDLPPDSPLVMDESFGPMALIQSAANCDEAFSLANAGSHGLVASLFSNDVGHQQQFVETVRAGMLSLNRSRPNFDPVAPFGGWGDSGTGVPEHGRWDRDFFTRPQAVYEIPKTKPQATASSPDLPKCPK